MSQEEVKKNNVIHLSKPCWTLKYCPYGSLVEQFPLYSEVSDTADYEMKCDIFGHICPVFAKAEPFVDGEPTNQKKLRELLRKRQKK